MHNEGYHVVRNNINAYFVVCCKWMAKLKDDPNSFTYYPPSNTHYQSLKKQIEAAPDWDFEQVKIMLANVQNLAEANRYIIIHTKHIDSEASENEQRMKSNKRKHPVAGILNLDFNNMITEEFNLSHNKKLKTLAPIHEEGSMESDDEGNSAMIKDSKTPKESVSYTNSFNEDKRSKSNNVEIEQLQDVQIEQMVNLQDFMELKNDIRQIKENQALMMERPNSFFLSVKSDFQFLTEKVARIASGSVTVENSPRPKPITNKNELIKMESNMITMTEEFFIEYQKLVAWFAINISKPNNGFGKHNGLVAVLLKIYFDAEFVRKIGWTSIKGRIPFEDYKGHHKFALDVCNKNTPGLFSNVDESGEACHEFFKRLHETKRPGKKGTSAVMEEVEVNS
ncbi:unnamed protein product [Chironomus riparius]|uniref:DUF4806 domain-containing protein n=1 Tax=Chironomus riparius TaxID=315576 RepID=A0A9N9RM65_9DIPT|nr:unnamed protein product [Chironomus riparius]